jgi:hypothetical protein
LSIEEGLRRRLIAMASSRRTRMVEFSRKAPCDWQANGITDPRTKQPFTEDGAWDYVCHHINSGVPIEVIELSNPPGKKAYVMLLPSNQPDLLIYVKLQVVGNGVLGRSFHYSNRKQGSR